MVKHWDSFLSYCIPGQIKLTTTSIYPFPTVAPNNSTSPIPCFDPSHASLANY